MATENTSEESKEETTKETASNESESSNSEDHEASWTRMDAMVRKAVNEELSKWSPPAGNKNSSGSGQKESSESTRKKETPRGFLGKWF